MANPFFSKVLVDNGAAVNVLPASTLKKIGKQRSDLKPADMIMTDFMGG